jgi:peptidoglycan/LPS O-acetylase OafA/YrhL
MFSFCIGVIAWRWRSAIPVSWPGAGLAFLVLVLGVTLGSLPIMALGVAYLALCSAWLPIRLRTDVSYGVYVLAYPTQTLLVIAGLGTSVFILVGVSIAVVMPLAWLSWRFVEQPALRIVRGHTSARPARPSRAAEQARPRTTLVLQNGQDLWRET